MFDIVTIQGRIEKDQKFFIEQPESEAWRKILHHGLFASIRIWERH